MNDYARRYMADKARRGRSDYSRGEYRGTMEYEGDYARRGSRGYDRNHEYDGRQGVKGTGRYGIGGSRYYGRDRAMDDYDYDDDYDMGYTGGMDFARGGERGRMGDYRRGYEMDYGDMDMMRLTKQDMHDWKRRMRNADGTMGEHFDKTRIEEAAEKIGIRYRDYDEKDLCMTVNMLYSDYCDALRAYIPQDKELIAYTKLAKAFLEDDDAAEEGAEKLAIYYNCIVKGDE